MSSVNPIQMSEPRKQPASAGNAAPSGDPFEALLESASATRRPDPEARGRHKTARQEPAAPRSRSEARGEALTRNDVTRASKQPDGTEAQNTPSADAAKSTDDAASEPASDTQTVSAQDADPAGEEAALPQEAETEIQAAATPAGVDAEGEAETATTALPATDGDATDDDTAGSDADDADQEPVQVAQIETPVEQTAAPLTDGAIETPVETVGQPTDADAPQPVQTASAAPGVTPVAAMDTTPELANVPAVAAEDVVPVQAAVLPAPAAEIDADAPGQIPAQPASMRAAASSSEQPQSQTAQQPSFAAALADEGSMPAFDDSGNEQLQQRPNAPQPANVKPGVDVKPEQFAEAMKPAPAAPETASVKSQLEALPEPLRALASTLNTPSANGIHFRAAAFNERVPIPLNGAALAAEIVSRARDGMQRFDIRLDPPELGRVDVRLEVDRAGNVKTRLTVDRPETLDLMQRDARGLERALQQSGLKTDSGGLEFSLRSHAEQGGHDGHANRGGRDRDAFKDEGGERIEAVIESYRSAALARGGVDIRI